MSQPSPSTSTSPHHASATSRTDRARLERLATALRGKLQFMDYLVRAAVADADRLDAEPDAGTRLFLQQLIAMHAQSLEREGDDMRQLAELCHLLESPSGSASAPVGMTAPPVVLRNGDAA
jgi:hypothetical protein